MMVMLAKQARNLFFGFLVLIIAVLAIFHPAPTMAIIGTAVTGVFQLAVQAANAIAQAVTTGAVPTS